MFSKMNNRSLENKQSYSVQSKILSQYLEVMKKIRSSKKIQQVAPTEISLVRSRSSKYSNKAAKKVFLFKILKLL